MGINELTFQVGFSLPYVIIMSLEKHVAHCCRTAIDIIFRFIRQCVDVDRNFRRDRFPKNLEHNQI